MDHMSDNIFQVSVKGVCFDIDGKIMMIQEPDGLWELPGGRIQKGEEFIDCLKRECLEETGLKCEVLDARPFIVYPTIDKEGRARIMVFFKISIKDFNFKPSDECVALKFYDKSEIRTLPTFPQLKKFPDFL